MNVKRSMIGVIAGALAWPGAMALADAPADDRLEERVETKLGDNDKIGHLDVDVQDGVVTLSGEVASLAEKSNAEKLARAAGAKKVVNRVEIDADKAVARIKERAAARKEQIDERADRAKEAVDRQAELDAKRAAEGKLPIAKTAPSVRRDKEVIDPAVNAKVKTRLTKEGALGKSDINVDERDGRVTLTGTVQSEAAHARAVELARTTEGVKHVVDKLTVKPDREALDAMVTTKVKDRFGKDDLLDEAGVAVETDRDGQVTLTGTVPSEAAHARAVDLARTTEGVRKVVDKLVVKAPVVRAPPAK